MSPQTQMNFLLLEIELSLVCKRQYHHVPVAIGKIEGESAALKLDNFLKSTQSNLFNDFNYRYYNYRFIF